MSNPHSDPLTVLYKSHHGWLKSWLRQRLGDSFLAADLSQDTFVKVMLAGSVERIQQPKPFLATVARRLMSDHQRRHILEASYKDMLAHLPQELNPSPEEQLQALQALHQVDKALDALPMPVREAFLLAHLQELSYAEIATRLGVSSSSVKQYLTKANRHCLFAIGN